MAAPRQAAGRAAGRGIGWGRRVGVVVVAEALLCGRGDLEARLLALEAYAAVREYLVLRGLHRPLGMLAAEAPPVYWYLRWRNGHVYLVRVEYVYGKRRER